MSSPFSLYPNPAGRSRPQLTKSPLPPQNIRLAYTAFHKVLSRKQSRYGEVIGWLGAEIWKLGLLKDIRHGRVRRVDFARP